MISCSEPFLTLALGKRHNFRWQIKATLKKGIASQFVIVTSEPILNELKTVLSRPKFKTGQEDINTIVPVFMRTAEIVNLISKFQIVTEDPKDNMVIETAFDGRADVIVSGDSHLLSLQGFRRIKIVTVRTMLESI